MNRKIEIGAPSSVVGSGWKVVGSIPDDVIGFLN
jgi:hypothetical protein